METLTSGFEVEARSGDILVDYNSPVYAWLKYQDRPIRGPVAKLIHTGARRVDMVNSSESPEKASNLAPQWQSDCGVSRIPRSIFKKIAANPETSVGELVKPKSTLKHVFGTGKDSQVSPREEVLFKYIDLTGVGCRRNYRDVRISAADMFVNLRRSRYGLRYIELDSKSKDLTKSEYIYHLITTTHQMIFRTTSRVYSKNGTNKPSYQLGAV